MIDEDDSTTSTTVFNVTEEEFIKLINNVLDFMREQLKFNKEMMQEMQNMDTNIECLTTVLMSKSNKVH